MASPGLARWTALLASALALASCSGYSAGTSGSAPPPTGAQLRDRLLTSTSLPAGIQVMLEATMTDHPGAASAGPDPCADLVIAYSIIGLTDTPAATAHVALRAEGSLPWRDTIEPSRRWRHEGAE